MTSRCAPSGSCPPPCRSRASPLSTTRRCAAGAADQPHLPQVALHRATCPIVHSAIRDIGSGGAPEILVGEVMIEYSNLKDQKELVARAVRAKERLDVSTQKDRDTLLHELLVRTHPSRESQLSGVGLAPQVL